MRSSADERISKSTTIVVAEAQAASFAVGRPASVTRSLK